LTVAVFEATLEAGALEAAAFGGGGNGRALFAATGFALLAGFTAFARFAGEGFAAREAGRTGLAAFAGLLGLPGRDAGRAALSATFAGFLTELFPLAGAALAAGRTSLPVGFRAVTFFVTDFAVRLVAAVFLGTEAFRVGTALPAFFAVFFTALFLVAIEPLSNRRLTADRKFCPMLYNGLRIAIPHGQANKKIDSNHNSELLFCQTFLSFFLTLARCQPFSQRKITVFSNGYNLLPVA
jgi:hypothetical protein